MLILLVVSANHKQHDLVQVRGPGYHDLHHFAGRRAAVEWLIDRGCCPGAAATLHDCEYGQFYSINAPTEPAGANAPA